MAELPRYRLTRGSFDIISVFGSLRASAIPGPVLTEVLGMRGYKPSAVRNQVTRLVQRGLLNREKAGATSVYSLDASMQHGFDLLSAATPPPPYTGEIAGILVAVPETMRSLRDRIVYTARFAGYRPLRPGVLIGFADASETLVAALAPELEEAGGTRDFHGADGVLWERCTFIPADISQARRWTEIAFDVSDLHAQLVEVEQIARRSTISSIDQSTYFDGFYETAQRVMSLPSLPHELTPGLSSNTRVAAAMASLIDLYVEKFAAEVVETALRLPSAHLISFRPDASWAPE